MKQAYVGHTESIEMPPHGDISTSTDSRSRNCSLSVLATGLTTVTTTPAIARSAVAIASVFRIRRPWTLCECCTTRERAQKCMDVSVGGVCVCGGGGLQAGLVVSIDLRAFWASEASACHTTLSTPWDWSVGPLLPPRPPPPLRHPHSSLRERMSYPSDARWDW